MLIVLNLFVVVFLLGMIALWATYGFFSALMNLVIVIASGVIAFAFWEPVTFMLLGRMPQYAHGVGLLVPFALSAIVLRVVFDKFCRMNVHVPRLADQGGGAFCGMLSGILAIGMLLNGANYLPMAREAFGWQPYEIQGGEMVDSTEGGTLWLGVHKWSAGFFSTLSGGSMSPMSGPNLAQARPELAKRAAVFRLAEDENQMRSAQPGSVEVTGVYAIPATEQALRGVVQRSTVTAFLAPGYSPPAVEGDGEEGNAFVDAVFDDFARRHADPATHGRPSTMLNLEAILATARVDGLRVDNPTHPENFRTFVQRVSDRVADDLAQQMGGVLRPDAQLLFVDTKWNNDFPGTYDTDGKLRVALTQVQLQAYDKQGRVKMLAPIGFSVEYSQNSGARTFTETVSVQQYAAFSPYPDFSLGWAFLLPDTHDPERFFVRELRFDLGDLPKAKDQSSSINRNPGALARVMGSPLLPKPAEEGAEPSGKAKTLLQGVQIAATGSYADVGEALPSTFSASAAGMETDQGTDPWTIISGKSDALPRGKGGQKSTVREVWVPKTDRLVRVKLSDRSASSLYGRARGLAASLGVMTVRDEGGNNHDAIGYALLKKNGEMQVDIRKQAFQGGLSASELPKVAKDETLFVYFQVPVGTSKIVSYMLSSDEQRFETPLTIERKKRR